MQPPFFTTTSCACSCFMEKLFIAIFWYFVIIILYCKTIQPVIFFQQHTFFIVYIYFNIQYNIELIFANTSIIEYWFFSKCSTFSPGIAPPISSILLLLYLKQKQHQEHRRFQSYSEKKTYSKIKVYCKQNRHFYRDFFLRIPDFFNFILV
jgi:hypothetical protein